MSEPGQAGGAAVLRRRVAAELFPPPAERGLRLPPARAAGVVVALLALATVLSLLRLGTDGYRTIWAEDGTVFMQSAFTHGYWQAIFEPYAGYLNVVPRVIGGLGRIIPLQAAAAVIAILSAFFAALTGLAVWHGSAGHVRDLWLRRGLTVATALAGTAGTEVLDSAAYVPWFMLVGTFWLLFARPRTWWGAGCAAAFVLLTGLSTPGVWFFLPVGALRIFSLAPRRDRREALVVGAWALGGLVQVPVLLTQSQGAARWSHHIWTALVQRVVDGGIFGQRLGGGFWDVGGLPFLALLCVAVAIALVVGLRRAPASARWFVALAIPISFGMFIVSAYQRAIGPSIYWPPGVSGGNAARYALVPSMVFLGALVGTLDGALRGPAAGGGAGLRPRSTWPALAGTALMLLAVAVSFDQTSSARARPYWGEALRTAADRCTSRQEPFAGITTAPAPFGLVVSCDQVEQFASPSVRAGSG